MIFNALARLSRIPSGLRRQTDKRASAADTSKVRRHNNKGPAHCDHLFIPGARSRATRSDRWGIYRYPKYIHFHFEHYAQVEERAAGTAGRGVIGARVDEAGDTTRQRQGITKSQ